MFFVILASILAGSVVWWLWADRRLRGRPVLRWAVGLFAAWQFLYIASYVVWPDAARQAHHWMPVPVIATAYLWHLIVVPLSLLAILLGKLAALPRREKPSVASRRGFLAACAAVAPPALTLGGVAFALPRLYDFRVRRLDVAVPGLPRGLDGVTIAHVTDLHVGKFSRARTLDRVVETVNGLETDLVLLTGDLIDLSLTDLDEGIDFLRRLDPRQGLFTCEGNHDLIDDGAEFRRRMRAAGAPLLLDESETILVKDEPVQILGLRWRRDGAEMAEAAGAIRAMRAGREEAFPILLAHHPHTFDHADGIPLTLAGHTHGGLLNLNDEVGAGPLLYRYWSGAYRRHDRAVVVSNGVGTWFPLRVEAPAEVVHLTLRAGL